MSRAFQPGRSRWTLRAGALAAALALCAAGCTHLGLAKKTVLQGSTVSDIQGQQVLNNLAMFVCNPNAMASHVKLTGGVVQLADTGELLLGANLGGPREVAPNSGFARSVLGQWNVDPVIDSGDLALLHIAYRKAVDPFDPDGSNKREAYETIAELANDYHIWLDRRLALEIVDTLAAGSDPPRQQRLARLRGELENLYAQIEDLSLRVDPYDPQRAARGLPGDVSARIDFLKEQAIRLVYETRSSAVGEVRAYPRPGRSVGLVEQAEAKIAALAELFAEPADGTTNPFAVPWVFHGCKKDVPKCACLVGHYCGCGCERYTWVVPENMAQFRQFVLIVLALAPPTPDDLAPQMSGVGAANSPVF
jgi:hypothetical protein